MAHKRKKRRVIKDKDLTKGINTASEVAEILKELENQKPLEQGVTGQDLKDSGLRTHVEELVATLKSLEPEKDYTNSNTSSAKVINAAKKPTPKRI
jgi:hypothetical protein